MDTITYFIPGDGSTTVFPIRWPYLHPSYVKVGLRAEREEEATPTEFTWLDAGRIEISPAPAAGLYVVITRQTPGDAALISFQDGSTFTGPQLNTISTQLLHLMQEGRDYTALVHDYVGKAEGYLEQLEGLSTAVAVSEAAAARADQILNLSIAVDDAPNGHVASGAYNPETGMLTLYVPKGPQGDPGENGTDGRDGRDGKDGADGNPGVIMDLQTGMFALEIIDGDLTLIHEDVDSPPNIHIDADGYLIWEQE